MEPHERESYQPREDNGEYTPDYFTDPPDSLRSESERGSSAREAQLSTSGRDYGDEADDEMEADRREDEADEVSSPLNQPSTQEGQSGEEKKSRLSGVKSIFKKKEKPKDTSSKESKKEKESFGGKIKGILKRDKKDDSSTSGTVIRPMPADVAYPDDYPQDDYPPEPEGQPRIYRPQSYAQPTEASSAPQNQSKATSTANAVRDFILHPPPRKRQEWIDSGPGIAEVKPPQEKHWYRCRNILWACLIAGLLAGIIMTALSSKGEAMEVLGPTFIALSLLTMVGTCFFALVFEEEPFPRLTPHLEKLDKLVEPRKASVDEIVMPWDSRAKLSYTPSQELLGTGSYPYPTLPSGQDSVTYTDEPSSQPTSSQPDKNYHEDFRQNSSYQDDVDPSLPPGSQYRESDQYPSDVDVVQYPPYHPEGYPNERQSDRISDPYANYPTEMFREQQQANYVQEEVSDEEEDEYEDDSVRKHRLPTSL